MALLVAMAGGIEADCPSNDVVEHVANGGYAVNAEEGWLLVVSQR
jgi:hypothetical protein